MESIFPRLPASATLDEALATMEAVRGSCVIVVDGRRPAGIVTEHDIVRLFLGSESNPTLGSVMTHPTISVREDCPLADAAQTMLNHGIRHLTVVDSDGNLAGLLSEHTLMSPLKLGLIDDALIDRQALARAREAMLDETADTERYHRALLDNFPFLVWPSRNRELTANRALPKRRAAMPSSVKPIANSGRQNWPAPIAPTISPSWLPGKTRSPLNRSSSTASRSGTKPTSRRSSAKTERCWAQSASLKIFQTENGPKRPCNCATRRWPD
jgi:predicted transcriptional regulator